MLELILLIGYIIIFGSFYLIWKYWYISKVDKFISGLNPFCGDEVKFHFNLNQDNITNIYL